GLFFFQAEDGIRDFHVTGVQTCALPIFEKRQVSSIHQIGQHDFAVACVIDIERLGKIWGLVADGAIHAPENHLLGAVLYAGLIRSEERRVGKARRWRWRPAQEAATRLEE